jgi:hypothetical protein
VKKSVPANSARWVRTKAAHVLVRLRSGAGGVTPQNIANRLIRNLVPQIGQRPRDPVIAPVPVLAARPNDQPLDLPLDPGPARASTRGAIELAGDELAIPAQDGVGSGHGRDIGKNLAAQAMTDLAQHASLGVRQLRPAIQLRLEDAVLGGQILVPRQQLLVNRSRHVGQDTRPIHNRPCPIVDDGVTGRPRNCTEPPQEPLPPRPNHCFLGRLSFLALRVQKIDLR